MAKLLLFAGLLAFACISQAARLPSDALSMLDSLPQSMMGFQGAATQQPSNEDTSAAAQVVGNMMASAAYSDLEMALATNENVQKGKGKYPIHVATKFLVKPDAHINFVHRWWSYNARSGEEKGIMHHSLSKVAGDNIVWTSYTVYEGVEAAFKHMRSEALRDFAGYLMTANIPVEASLVFPIHGCHCKHCHKKNENGANNGGDCFALDDAAGADMAATPFAAAAAGAAAEDNKKKRGWPVRLVTKYIVPPRDGRAFVKEFGKMAEALEGAKGKLALVLSKPAGDNTLFVSYSAWDSYESLGKAGQKGAVRDFLKYLTDKDIVVINKKVWRVPSSHP